MDMIYKSLADVVYEFISEQINNGSLKENQRISESKIAEELQVSRTPVREALIQLSSEGCINKSPRKGFTVKEINNKRLSNIYFIIGNLEATAARLSINNMKEKDIVTLRELVNKMDNAIDILDYNEYFSLQSKFHNTFINLSGNDELNELIQMMKKRLIMQDYFLFKIHKDSLFQILRKTNKQHMKIVELFEKKNEEELTSYIKFIHWGTDYMNK